MKDLSLLILSTLLVLSTTSCNSLTKVRMMAKFEHATNVWFDNEMNLKFGTLPCRIANIRVIKEFNGNGKLIGGRCDGVPHVYAVSPRGLKIDLTASCKNFEKFLEIEVKNFEISNVKTYKDKLVYNHELNELLSEDVLNFTYIKSALEYLKNNETAYE